MKKQNNEEFIAGIVMIGCSYIFMLFALIWTKDRLPLSIGGSCTLALGLSLTCFAYYRRVKDDEYQETLPEYDEMINGLVQRINNLLERGGHTDCTAYPGDSSSVIEIRKEGTDKVSKLLTVESVEHYLKQLEEQANVKQG